MSNNHPYGGGYDGDEFASFMHEDGWLYRFCDAYCQLFENLSQEEMLKKFKLIFEMAGESKQRKAFRENRPRVDRGIIISTNRASICGYINILAERIYTNRLLAEHPEAITLARYLPQYLTSDDDLFNLLTEWAPKRSSKTIAFRFMKSRGISGEENSQHIIWLPIPEGLTPGQAADDFKLLDIVCREMR